MLTLNIEWKIIDSDRVASLFDKATFSAFQTAAAFRGLETTDMIAGALAELLEPDIALGSTAS
jgi:hypothetical protein